MNKKILLSALILVIIIGAIVGAYFLLMPNPVSDENPVADSDAGSSAEKAAITTLVENFGDALKNVSLLSPTAAADIEANYRDYLAPELLAKWENDPGIALGRLTSSPWPDRIEISEIEAITSEIFSVSGKLIEITSADTPGEAAATKPIALAVTKTNGRWLITGVTVTSATGVKNESNPGVNSENTGTTTTNIATGDWITATASGSGVIFKYPESLGTQFIRTNVWPPEIRLSAPGQVLNCATTTSASGLIQSMDYKTIDGRDYCVGATSEGAAGSTYTEYTYATGIGNSVITLDFTLQYPQCLNYDDPRQTECLNERDALNIDSLVADIISTITIPASGGNTVNWDDAARLIDNCMVSSVFQSHDLTVTLELKNGEKYVTTEPQIDDIFDIVNASESVCGHIPSATE